MFAGTSHGTELKRFFRLPLTRAALAVMLLIPLLYGAMYVWAFWDPTARMDQLPVALVNEDRPTTLDGKTLAAGQETADKLIEKKPFQWHQVDAATAADGVKRGTYYFAITIPADYSTRIASLKSDSPQRAQLDVSYDDSNSFLASTLGQSAMLRIKEAVNEASGQQAVEKLLISLDDVRTGLGTASDGAFTLADGLKTAADGTVKLEVGTAELNKGAQALASGSGQLAAGTASAVQQTAPLAPGVAQLDSGAAQLAAGLDALSAKVPTLTGGVHQLALGAAQTEAGARQLSDGTTRYVTGVSKAGDGVAQLAAGTTGLQQLLAGLAQLNDPTRGAPALAAGTDKLAGGIQQLTTGAQTLASGATDYAAGATTFANGAQSFSSQVGTLSSGAQQVAAGAKQTSTGATQLNGGLQQLKTALAPGGTLASALTSDDAQTRTAALAQLRNAINTSADGSATLSTGATNLSAGATNLATKTSDASTGFTAGATKLTTAATSLTTGASTLQSGVTALTQQTSSVKDLQTGAHALADGIAQMSAKASNSTSGLPAMIGGLTQLNDAFQNPDPHKGLIAGAKALNTGSNQLASGTTQLAAGAAQLDAGTGQLSSGVTQLVAGSHQLASGTSTLNSKVPALVAGVQQLDAGAAKIANGATQLATGTDTLATKVPELSDGLAKARDGSTELATKLQDGRDQIPNDTSTVRQARSESVQAPVAVSETWVDKAASWGEGFAPFFISLALWVGALITWLLLRPLQSRPLMTSVSGFRTAWGSLNSALMLAIGQVLIMLAVMHFAIGLGMANPVAVVLFTLLTAFSFMAMQQFFQVAFGTAPGKVIIIAILMVQLASAGGTYPIETEPGFLRAINPYMPMTYVVQGLREAITGGIDHRFWMAVLVLASIFVVSLAGSSIMASRKRMWSMSRLHPALSL